MNMLPVLICLTVIAAVLIVQIIVREWLAQKADYPAEHDDGGRDFR